MPRYTAQGGNHAFLQLNVCQARPNLCSGVYSYHHDQRAETFSRRGSALMGRLHEAGRALVELCGRNADGDADMTALHEALGDADADGGRGAGGLGDVYAEVGGCHDGAGVAAREAD